MTTQHRPFFVSQSFTNAIPFLSFILSCLNTCLQLWETSLPRKKKLKPALLVQYSPPHPGKGQIPTPGKASQNPHIPHGYWKCSNTWGLLELLIWSANEGKMAGKCCTITSHHAPRAREGAKRPGGEPTCFGKWQWHRNKYKFLRIKKIHKEKQR